MGFGDEHLANADALLLAGLAVETVIEVEGFLELQGNTFAHDTLGIDGVDEGIGGCLQQISFCVQKHGGGNELIRSTNL